MSGLAKAHGFPTAASVLALASLHSPTIYNDLANCGDFARSSSRAEAEVSAHGDEAARMITTLLTEGKVTLPLFFIATAGQEPTHTDATNGLESIYKRNDLRSYAIFLRDTPGTAYFFNAMVSTWGEKYPLKGVHGVDITFTIDGKVLKGTEAGGVSTAVFAPAEA